MIEVGVINIIGWDEIKLWFCCNIVFYFGVGGCVFNLINDSEFIYRMILLKLMIIKMIIVGIILGVKWYINIVFVGIWNNCVIFI